MSDGQIAIAPTHITLSLPPFPTLPGGLANTGHSLGHVYSVPLFLRPLISTVKGTKKGTKRITAPGPYTRPHSLITVAIETRSPHHLQATPPTGVWAETSDNKNYWVT
ncbi:unnamed protein product [Pleuronectes platessa]|uniref:Uncharacterized protein n=1 Tax=Pleuronectes platessa TaxID=8262 RepID=A0A9N7V759_PLEPL|nr:unnamed protein product [Pleuronectes platessa]